MEAMLVRLTDPGHYQALPHFITHAVWDVAPVWQRLVQRVPVRRGVLIIDDTGWLKQGQHSVGVARQYCGAVGKVANCQVAVTTMLWARQRAWPLGMTLYLPKDWTRDAARRTRVGIPPTVFFQEKWRLALTWLRRARAAGIALTAVVADAGFGDVSAFREVLHQLKLPYALGVSSQLTVFLGTPRVAVPAATGRRRVSAPASRSTCSWRRSSCSKRLASGHEAAVFRDRGLRGCAEDAAAHALRPLAVESDSMFNRTVASAMWLTLGLAALTLDAAGVPDANWPQWRGPQGLAVSSDAGLPTEWSPATNIAWKTEIPGRGHSSPVVWGDRIFLTTSIKGPQVPGRKAPVHLGFDFLPGYVHPDSTDVDYRYTLKVLAINATTGRIAWERTAYDGLMFDDRHRKNTFASPTMATDGRLVFAFFESLGLFAYDFEGRRRWPSAIGCC